MITNPEIIAKVFIHALNNAYEEGLIEPDFNGDLYFKFEVSAVIGVHFHKIGVGDGVWFRLLTGEVWGSHGEQEQEADPKFYDTVPN